MEEIISPEDINKITMAKVKLQLAIAQAEKTTAEARVADLEYRSLVQHIFLSYGLKMTDRIDDATGRILREGDPQEVQAEAPVVEASAEAAVEAIVEAPVEATVETNGSSHRKNRRK